MAAQIRRFLIRASNSLHKSSVFCYLHSESHRDPVPSGTTTVDYCALSATEKILQPAGRVFAHSNRGSCICTRAPAGPAHRQSCARSSINLQSQSDRRNGASSADNASKRAHYPTCATSHVQAPSRPQSHSTPLRKSECPYHYHREQSL